jgi:hypothetical protein
MLKIASFYVIIGVLGTGCVLNGRRVLLKEYGPTSTPTADARPLKDVTVCIKGFTLAQNTLKDPPKGKSDQPQQFKYTNFTRDQDHLWDKEQQEIAKRGNRAEWREIGNMRNGFGMVMSHVYAVNDPAAWLADTLKMDLIGQGAKVVDASQASSADVSVTGTLEVCRVDMYMTVSADLLVDLELTPKSGEKRSKTFHTTGSTLASMASEGEYYHALREARQKLSSLTMSEISNSLHP